MFFAIITLLSSFSLAAVAGWFSIIGFMTIYSGAPMYALIMGVVMECAKLVTASWLYRNWNYSNWKLKLPLIYFLSALMLATSIGVFGLLSKSHLEQTAGVIDNGPKVEKINYQIAREESRIADNEKVIQQLDAAVNSYLERNITNRAVSVRRSQQAQRQALREDIQSAQQRIDELNSEKFQLESEVRKLELEVGPIRYISEIIHGTDGNTEKNIESAVKIFTLLLVSALDPLAVVLLIAANSTLERIRRHGESTDQTQNTNQDSNQAQPINVGQTGTVDTSEDSRDRIQHEGVEKSTSFVGSENKDLARVLPDRDNNKDTSTKKVEGSAVFQEAPDEETFTNDLEESLDYEHLKKFLSEDSIDMFVNARSPSPTPIDKKSQDEDQNVPAADKEPWAHQEPVLRELLGNKKHFVPKKVIETDMTNNITGANIDKAKYPKVASWLKTFKETDNGRE